ncbi:branched-chain amino acid transport system permease protein [Desulfofundulus australicus DSM 11792]|jgi:branched-chain amino acid transport system permease protein|uniref:Branched-chain amino acid transport system permease protein n=1 Tax=Desulfofundulus australicus DSM 11792 TaxID=1121425 RepID=A0A1M4SJZ5_9FIRM|nr:branched-chain amino acid ABC transporter permease [Desulfofundulus australicus]MDK2888216.1 branched-chain amino acid transport system permease protein [Thermoanaerobacter sp.]SHE32482.1 branched-chain amino acid transport system permease protein [Desulfofundulus australicus DSM 11792]
MGVLSSIINGILMGGVYGLLAMGLTLIFGIMKIINFAHGAFLMVAMILSYWLWKIMGLDPYLSIIIIAPLMFLLGYLTQRFTIKPVLDAEKDVREPIGALLLTAGLAVAIENFILMVFGADYLMAKTAYSGASINISSLSISVPRLYAFVTSLVVAFLFYQFLIKTELGRAMRATGQDRGVALLMGINVSKVYSIAFGIGTALAGLAGIVLIPFYYAHPSVGAVFITKAFIIVVLGGLGSVHGALVGGLIIGLIESVAAQYMTATWTAILIYFAFLAFLLLKPSGLFGSRYEW